MSPRKQKSKIDDLLVDLSSYDWERRYNSVRKLGYLGKPVAVEFLLPLLKDPHDSVRRQTIYSLGLLRDRRAVEPLINRLPSGGDAAAFAAGALGEIGDQRAFEPLLKALAGQFGDGVRHFAAAALGKVGDERAFAPLMEALHDDDVIVRIAATDGLGYLGNEAALPALEWAKQHDKDIDEFGISVKDAAIKAIKRIRQQS